MINAGGGNQINSLNENKILKAGGMRKFPRHIALGTSVCDWEDSFSMDGINASVGDSILFGLLIGLAPQSWTVEVNGITKTFLGSKVSTSIILETYGHYCNTALVDASISVVFDTPCQALLVASKFNLLRGAAFQYIDAIGNSNTPDSSPTYTYGLLPQIHYGLIGSNGMLNDNPGTWNSLMIQGQRVSIYDSTPSLLLTEGYRIDTNAIVSARAALTSVPVREWAAAVTIYA